MPAERGGEISEEMIELFDRALTMRQGPERKAVTKQLQILAGQVFEGRWTFGNPSPADPCFDGPCCIDARDNWLHINWSAMQRDRQVLLAAHAAWRKRTQAA
jgi:hypothetical protein